MDRPCSETHPERPSGNAPWWSTGIAVFVAPTASSGDSVVGKPRERTSADDRHPARRRPSARGSEQRIFFLDFWLHAAHVPSLFFLARQERCVPAPGFVADGGGFWECEAVARKMYTFVSGKKRMISTHYQRFMYTFVYPAQKVVLAKSRT